jgi:hypothetical protein
MRIMVARDASLINYIVPVGLPKYAKYYADGGKYLVGHLVSTEFSTLQPKLLPYLILGSSKIVDLHMGYSTLLDSVNIQLHGLSSNGSLLLPSCPCFFSHPKEFLWRPKCLAYLASPIKLPNR